MAAEQSPGDPQAAKTARQQQVQVALLRPNPQAVRHVLPRSMLESVPTLHRPHTLRERLRQGEQQRQQLLAHRLTSVEVSLLSLYVPTYVYLSMSLSMCLLISESIYVSTYLCVYLSMCLLIYVSTYLCVYLSMCLLIYVSIYVSIHAYVCVRGDRTSQDACTNCSCRRRWRHSRAHPSSARLSCRYSCLFKTHQ
ncbi:MAG: hypothetical protein MHM6MM_007779 [Cercozoa sp. M6MM]